MLRKEYQLVVKGIIYNEKQEILTIQRSLNSKQGGGKWDFPGGKVDVGENFAEAFLREVKEETNLEIELLRFFDVFQGNSPQKILVYLIAEAKLIGGTIQLSDEHIAYNWINKKKFKKIDVSEHFNAFIKRINY